MVIATGTLAFGINMPTRTVVFAGDHLFLSALQYRQMAGRAGRRGFDLLGCVVYFGIGERKIRSLMVGGGGQHAPGAAPRVPRRPLVSAAAQSRHASPAAHPDCCRCCRLPRPAQVSPVPRLLGHFPITTTMCLRGLALHYAADFAAPGGLPGGRLPGGSRRAGGTAGEVAPRVRDALATLFRRPFYAAQDPALLQKMQHLFRSGAAPRPPRPATPRPPPERPARPACLPPCSCLASSLSGRRFSVEWLVRAGAIDLEGRPMGEARQCAGRQAAGGGMPWGPPGLLLLLPVCAGMTGMLCHLHWTDPANLALASILSSGALHDICK